MIGSAPVKPTAAGGWHETSNSELHDVVHTSDNFLQTPLRAFPKQTNVMLLLLVPSELPALAIRCTGERPMNVPQDGYFSAEIKRTILARLSNLCSLSVLALSAGRGTGKGSSRGGVGQPDGHSAFRAP